MVNLKDEKEYCGIVRQEHPAPYRVAFSLKTNDEVIPLMYTSSMIGNTCWHSLFEASINKKPVKVKGIFGFYDKDYLIVSRIQYIKE